MQALTSAKTINDYIQNQNHELKLTKQTFKKLSEKKNAKKRNQGENKSFEHIFICCQNKDKLYYYRNSDVNKFAFHFLNPI